jgi:hypothetical protein
LHRLLATHERLRVREAELLLALLYTPLGPLARRAPRQRSSTHAVSRTRGRDASSRSSPALLLLPLLLLLFLRRRRARRLSFFDAPIVVVVVVVSGSWKRTRVCVRRVATARAAALSRARRESPRRRAVSAAPPRAPTLRGSKYICFSQNIFVSPKGFGRRAETQEIPEGCVKKGPLRTRGVRVRPGGSAGFSSSLSLSDRRRPSKGLSERRPRAPRLADATRPAACPQRTVNRFKHHIPD